MGFIQSITEMFESIFKRSSPEVQKKQQLKKLEAEIRTFEPVIFRNGNLQPNFAEAIYALYKNTKPLNDLFSVTVSSADIPRQHRFEAQLIITGYSPEFQKIIEDLTFENRKEEVLDEPTNPDRIYIRQRNQLERTLKELNSESFRRMDRDILDLRQFVDFCKISFSPILQIFDSNFNPGMPGYVSAYAEVPVSKAVNLLEDLYYQISGMKITSSLADEITAIAQLRKGDVLSNSEANAYLKNLKTINYIITKILTPDHLKALLRYAREDLIYEPRTASYTGSPRQEFANLFQSRFDSDEQRIKSEIQDEQISTDVAALFKKQNLEELVGYNSESNRVLQANTALSLKWILPMRVLKTFLKIFISDSIKSLLNDIVIEGFFNSPAYKTEFSTTVYAVINAFSEIEDFEASFAEGQRNSVAVMRSYIKDSHKDKDFYRKLDKMVMIINNDAHKLLQSVITTLYNLYTLLGELLADSRKPSSEIVSNLKVLMMSSRNKDNTSLLEEQYPDWKIFFEIMKNYVIINKSEIK